MTRVSFPITPYLSFVIKQVLAGSRKIDSYVNPILLASERKSSRSSRENSAGSIPDHTFRYNPKHHSESVGVCTALSDVTIFSERGGHFDPVDKRTSTTMGSGYSEHCLNASFKVSPDKKGVNKTIRARDANMTQLN